MLKTLIMLRLRGLLAALSGASRSRGARSRGQVLAYLAVLALAGVSMSFFFSESFAMLAGPFHAAGLDWLYFALAALMSLSLMFIGSVFTAKAQLYEAKDNDLLLSLPVPPGAILLSRMLLLWIIALLMALLAGIPALLVWQRDAGFGALGACSFVLIFFVLLPLFSLALSALLGWLLHLASGQVRNKSLVTVALSLLFFGAYMVAVSRMETWLGELAQQGGETAEKLGNVAPLWWIGRACAAGDLPSLGLAALLCLVPAGLTWLVLSRSFIRTATARGGGRRVRYVEKQARVLPLRQALLRREARRFFASPAYILNCGMGLFMAVAGMALLLFKREALAPLLSDSGLALLLKLGLVLALCFCAAMAYISAPSVSLEGKSLWLARSLPIASEELLRAKLRFHLLASLPPLLLASLLAAAVSRPEGLLLLCYPLLPAATSLFIGLLGLAEGLRHPNLDWTNETQVLKNGPAVIYTMLLGWAALLPPAAAMVLLGGRFSPGALGLAWCLVLLGLSALLWRWLLTRGLRRLEAL